MEITRDQFIEVMDKLAVKTGKYNNVQPSKLINDMFMVLPEVVKDLSSRIFETFLLNHKERNSMKNELLILQQYLREINSTGLVVFM